VAAWAEAVDGNDTSLLEVATPEAVSELLYGGDASKKTRVVVRGPTARAIRIMAVDVSHEPATMKIEVELGGRRYVEDRDTAAVVSGSKERSTTFSGRWTLVLQQANDGLGPWLLARPTTAAAE
jgi:predicted lipid-binding transport protein (Tim44 family)